MHFTFPPQELPLRLPTALVLFGPCPFVTWPAVVNCRELNFQTGILRAHVDAVKITNEGLVALGYVIDFDECRQLARGHAQHKTHTRVARTGMSS